MLRVINKTLNDLWLLTTCFKKFTTICKGLIDVFFFGYELKENFGIINFKI